MLKVIRQARVALSMLNPDQVRMRASRRLRVGLVADGDPGYMEMEQFLAPAEGVYRATDPEPPDRVDLVFYARGIAPDAGALTLDPGDPDALVDEILREREELALPLARQFPAFRKPVVDRIVQAVAVENAMFAIATALPNVVPNLIEVPWVIGEFASDTAFLTANQVRMAFLIAGACGKEIGLARQKAQVLPIVAGAFGWRALARELTGKIPLGGGLIPKGAIAYAGTYAVGKGLEYYHQARGHYTRAESEAVYRQAFETGRQVAQSIVNPE